MQITMDAACKKATITDFDPKMFSKAKIPASYTIVISPSVDPQLLQNLGRSITYDQQTTYVATTEGTTEGTTRVLEPKTVWVQQLAPIV